MGNIYVTCARCNKGMMIAEYNCVFCSDIDNQFVCSDCYKKEQPKELMKKIQELETKLAESEKAFDTICAKYEKKSEQIFEIIKRQEECSDAYDLLSKENAQLKNKLAEKKKYTYTGKEVGEIERNYESQIADKDQAIESLQEINQSLGQTCNNDAKEIERLNKLLAEKDKEIEIEKKLSDWLYDIYNRTKFEEEVAQKCKTATEITKQCDLYECCKNQYINDLRSEVKKKLKY